MQDVGVADVVGGELLQPCLGRQEEHPRVPGPQGLDRQRAAGVAEDRHGERRRQGPGEVAPHAGAPSGQMGRGDRGQALGDAGVQIAPVEQLGARTVEEPALRLLASHARRHEGLVVGETARRLDHRRAGAAQAVVDAQQDGPVIGDDDDARLRVLAQFGDLLRVDGGALEARARDRPHGSGSVALRGDGGEVGPELRAHQPVQGGHRAQREGLSALRHDLLRLARGLLAGDPEGRRGLQRLRGLRRGRGWRWWWRRDGDLVLATAGPEHQGDDDGDGSERDQRQHDQDQPAPTPTCRRLAEAVPGEGLELIRARDVLLRPAAQRCQPVEGCLAQRGRRGVVGTVVGTPLHEPRVVGGDTGERPVLSQGEAVGRTLPTLSSRPGNRDHDRLLGAVHVLDVLQGGRHRLQRRRCAGRLVVRKGDDDPVLRLR